MTFLTLHAAALGSLKAMRTLAGQAYARATQPGECLPLAYAEAITFARLAAAHGDRTDCHLVVHLLSELAAYFAGEGNDKLAIKYEGQALHLAEALAQDGDSDMADIVIAAADKIAPEAYIEARRLAEQAGAPCRQPH